jgi:hypothetical protein
VAHTGRIEVPRIEFDVSEGNTDQIELRSSTMGFDPQVVRTDWHRNPSASSLAISPQTELYGTLINVLRDQITAQTASAGSNDLQCVALIAADVALIVGLMIIRATAQAASWGSWWWIPLLGLAASATPLVIPVLPGSKRMGIFKIGPSVPNFSSCDRPRTLVSHC